ncbi:MAG: hypothetical protein J5I93_13435, partial [Pirellulaceae bacterium]|nr:hypothetical protein [Pirellulaceae bacterium]
MASEAIGYPEQGSSATARLELAPNVRSALRGLRRRIRLYVWAEGLVLAFIWLGLTFWLALAVDYLTVYFAGAELPVWTRACILFGVGVGLAVILAYWVLARAFTSLPDHSMAVLLERRFAGFGDSLVTAVEMSEEPDHARPFSREMLDQANQRAQAQIDSVRLGDVFNVRRLIWKFVLAVLLLLPAGLVWGQTLQTGFDRLVLLKNVDWPRSARIEVVGVQVQRAVVDPNLPAAPLVPFEDRSIKVARHSSLTLHVRADVTAPKVPEFCTIWYTTTDGDRGRVIMKKIGRPRDQYQQYTFDEKPLKGILTSLDFSVRGYDHRLHDYHVEVVDNPAVINTKLQ